jgi:hypothetical protein
MKQADMGVSPINHFARHLQDQTQHAVRSRMLRPEIDIVTLDFLLGHDRYPFP